jgi:hypothetical protein
LICSETYSITQALDARTMPTLRNPRHERFAQLLASGKTAKDAYALAGYKPSDSNGAWLAHKEQISSRVAEINNQAIAKEQKTAAVAAERAAITRQGLIDMARDVYVQAKEVGQTAAAVAALKEIGVSTSGIRRLASTVATRGRPSRKRSAKPSTSCMGPAI